MKTSNPSSRSWECRVGLRSFYGVVLFDLMVGFAIAGVVLAAVYPSYRDSVLKARRVQATVDLVETAEALERYYSIHHSYKGFPLNSFVAAQHGGNPTFYIVDMPAQRARQYILRATPAIGSRQADDRCGVLTLTQNGVKSASGGTVAECWR